MMVRRRAWHWRENSAWLRGLIPIIATAHAGEDSVVLTFVGFLEREMQAKPGDIVPADAAQFKRIGKLVAGVKTGRVQGDHSCVWGRCALVARRTCDQRISPASSSSREVM